ncbi:hypothetical protein BDA99DRAFT_528875 [Phascolomyces articulosus]|uniref:Uncharacterized protein n=1 Tax=Phascolomyces articulosus TaxID=60185 RepID=A0AAD5JWY7_9FUNG|nr:hypothetical protein BDA99DRAFT_528875 [Phascolomyces articulosus]
MPLFFFKKSSRKIHSEVSHEQVILHQQAVQEAQRLAADSLSRDPMRMSNVPDVLGGFVDPMGGARASFSISRDPTCTGA